MKRITFLGLCVLTLSSCAGKQATLADTCAGVQQKITAGQTLTPEEQSCVNREVSSVKPQQEEQQTARQPVDHAAKPGSSLGYGRAY